MPLRYTGTSPVWTGAAVTGMGGGAGLGGGLSHAATRNQIPTPIRQARRMAGPNFRRRLREREEITTGAVKERPKFPPCPRPHRQRFLPRGERFGRPKVATRTAASGQLGGDGPGHG